MKAVKGVDAEGVQVEDDFLDWGILRCGRRNGRRDLVLLRLERGREGDGGGMGRKVEVSGAEDGGGIWVVEGEGSGSGGDGGGCGGEVESFLHSCYIVRRERGNVDEVEGGDKVKAAFVYLEISTFVFFFLFQGPYGLLLYPILHN